MKIITVYCTGKPDRKTELILLCKSMLKPSRQEIGCIQYDFYQDMNDSNKFFFYEEWESQEAIDRHNISDHFIDFQPQFQNMIAKAAIVTIMEIK